MKYLILFPIILSISTATFGQQAEPVAMNVLYQFVHVADTNNRQQPLTEDMLLQVGPTTSKYIRAASKRRPQVVQQQVSAAPATVVTGSPMAVVNGPGISDLDLIQSSTGKLHTIASLGLQSYVMESALPKINWVVSEEEKTIGGYNCQKATGRYAGRNYTAWFCPALPFRCGPWKLSGLPGLILEAADDKKEVAFLFKEISKDTTGDETSTTKRAPIKVSQEAYNRARKAFYENPVAAVQSQLPATAPAVRLLYRDAGGQSYRGDAAEQMLDSSRKKLIYGLNNPLELKQ